MTRFIISAILGLAVTVGMLATALHFFDEPVNKASLRRGIEVVPLPDHHRVDVAEWLRQARGDLVETGDIDPERLPTPPPERLPREVHGFVQLTFTVQPDGTATDVRVFGAVPPGLYETQATEQVRARRWEPGVDAAGDPVARRATEVIEFSVPDPDG